MPIRVNVTPAVAALVLPARCFRCIDGRDRSYQTPTSTAPPLEVFYGPLDAWGVQTSGFFPLVAEPSTAWPALARRTSYFKMFVGLLGPQTTDSELRSLIRALNATGIRTALEIGGARWGGTQCTTEAVLSAAAREQALVSRWLRLGGAIDHVTTDHALVWDVRQLQPGAPCKPRVPMRSRIDAVAQMFASWRRFLPCASLGFIESLGFWDIAGPDGTNYTNTSPEQLNKIPGWIPRLDDVTGLLLAACEKYNPAPSTPLLDHYQIDFGLGGIEHDTARYGRRDPTGVNYGRILGAESVMARHGLKTGVILNAFHGGIDSGPNCLLSCDQSPAIASHSAIVRTLNFTQGYLSLPNRLSEHAVLEQWMQYPNVTGPETVQDTNMWMASHAAKLIMPSVTTI